MKIVALGLRGFPNVQGGVETHCENLYPLIVAQGHDVTVLARSPYTKKAPYEYKGVKIVPIFCPKQKFLEAIIHTFLGVIKAKSLKPDILHIHAVGPAIMAPLARMLGMKVVITHHGPDYERKKWNGFAKFILKTGECWGVKAANKVICIAQNIADSVKAKYGVTSVVIPNGVVVPAPVTSAGILEEYDLTKGKYILAVGRFVPEKGFHDLIEAFRLDCESEVLRKGNWKLVIVGEAVHEDSYSLELKSAAKAVPNVVLTGFQKGLPLKELYQHAGLFVLPSYYEGLPIVLLEALSYGLSCLVSDIPANRNVTLPQGRFFRVGDIGALAAKIIELAQRPLTTDERTAQLTMIAKEYNWPSIAEQTIKAYNV